ncbi:hypothetical protein [Allokutzneria oryzae]|uniref:Uncharacterized protein n=1 Tax=Allokutzneria oryzae TaxID=1378989 RepID=A0ABV6AC44_9PSEU
MCVSTGPADFVGTTLYLGRRRHERHGLIEVLGYQNTVRNLGDGPNAMVLHLPVPWLTEGSFLPVGRDGDVLDAMLKAARPVLRGGPDEPAAMSWMDGSPAVEVFEHDVYTVVLAGDPTLIPDALHRVPEHKRPVLDRELFEFYADVFPGRAIALCCFDNADAQRAKPLFLWYPPVDRDQLVLPALDCHSGAVPDLDALVRTDHWLVFGTDEAEPGWGAEVRYSGRIRRKLRAFLPDAVLGADFTEKLLPNGDFAIDYDDLLRGDLSGIERVRPGGA